VSRVDPAALAAVAPCGLRAAALFGSRAKGVARPDSDVDVLFVTRGGKGWSAFASIDETEIHISVVPDLEFARDLPPKWWEPLATARVLPIGADAGWLRERIEMAIGLWKSQDARHRAADRSVAGLVAKLRTRGAGPLRSIELRAGLDGSRSIACFRAGHAEPSKHRRISGVEAVLGRQAGHFAALGLSKMRQETVVGLAEGSWDHAIEFIRTDPVDPLRKSFLGGRNRWAHVASHVTDPRDAVYYLGFSLDKLVVAARARERLLASPWFRDLNRSLHAACPSDDGVLAEVGAA
jgi:Nucleotidyltransferase domain